MKRIFFSIVILIVSTSIVFAQSRLNFSTAGLFDDYSDKISAKDIYELGGAFASLGYDGCEDDKLAPFGAFGIAISPTMYFGVIGGIEFKDTKNESPTDPDTNISTYASPFNVTLAFGLNQNMGFHYTLTRDGTDTVTKVDKYAEKITTETKDADWTHEIAFGMKFVNGAELYVPLSIPITLYTATHKGYDTTTAFDESEGPSVLATDGFKDSSVNLSLNPTFTMPLDLGLFNRIKFGAGIDFAVYSNLNERDNTNGTSTSPTTTTTQDASKDYINTQWNIFATPTFEWDISAQINFRLEPTVGLIMDIESNGQIQPSSTSGTATDPAKDVTTLYAVKPFISVPVGIVMKPVDWFEIRTGVKYAVEWNITETETETETETAKISNDAAPHNSIFLYGGFGFILAKNFFIDIAFASSDILPGVTYNSTVHLFDDPLDSVTLQFSYKF